MTHYASFDDSTLRIGNALVERAWRLIDGQLYATSFLDKSTGRDWIARPSAVPSLTPPGPQSIGDPSVEFNVSRGVDRPVELPSLVTTLKVSHGNRASTFRFKIFDDSPAVSLQLILDGFGPLQLSPAALDAAPSPTGIEQTATRETAKPIADAIDCFPFNPLHHRLTQVELFDRTDVHNNLVHERDWLLHPAEPLIRAAGNLFFLEDRITEAGLIFLKLAPLPHARPVKSDADIEVALDSIRLLSHGLDNDGAGYALVTIPYSGGRAGRIATLQKYQRQLRPYQPQRDGLLLSNTWGDRSKDGRICEAFMLTEIEAAAAARRGGRADRRRLAARRERQFCRRGRRVDRLLGARRQLLVAAPRAFPQRALAARRRRERNTASNSASGTHPIHRTISPTGDATPIRLLALHREHHINHFKIDGVKMYTASRRAKPQSLLRCRAGRVVRRRRV